jgi:hypothetical protein
VRACVRAWAGACEGGGGGAGGVRRECSPAQRVHVRAFVCGDDLYACS